MWQRKNLSYDICIPPIDKPFSLLSSIEAKNYFDWYISKIPERISYLSGEISKAMKKDLDLIDFSPDSLEIIWRWFLGEAHTETSASNVLQLDMQTEYIIRDIGMYVGELFNSRYTGINWSYYETPKTDFFVNRPVLIGFKDKSVFPPFCTVFEPIYMVRVQACKILLNRQKKDDLLNLYNKWEKNLI